MKQIQSIFIDDKEYEELVKLKKLNEWTWKDLILSTIKGGNDEN